MTKCQPFKKISELFLPKKTTKKEKNLSTRTVPSMKHDLKIVCQEKMARTSPSSADRFNDSDFGLPLDFSLRLDYSAYAE